MPDEALLEVRGITAGYGRVQVLWGVDLAVHERESVVLLGANGAGKTTLLKALMSLIDAWAGRIDFAGEDITRLRTDQRVKRGFVFMSEASGFPGLTIEENILIGAQFMPRERARRKPSGSEARKTATRSTPSVSERRSQICSSRRSRCNTEVSSRANSCRVRR